MVNEKATIILLTVGLIGKTWYKWLYIFQNQILQEKQWKLNLDLSELDLKDVARVDTSKFAKKVDFANSNLICMN